MNIGQLGRWRRLLQTGRHELSAVTAQHEKPALHGSFNYLRPFSREPIRLPKTTNLQKPAVMHCQERSDTLLLLGLPISY